MKLVNPLKLIITFTANPFQHNFGTHQCLPALTIVVGIAVFGTSKADCNEINSNLMANEGSLHLYMQRSRLSG